MRHGVELAERLLDDIDAVAGGFGRTWLRPADVAALQLLWGRYMATGADRFGDAVLQSLRAICGSALVDQIRGGVYRLDRDDRLRHPRVEKDLCDNAQLLELLTWVWRVERCSTLRHCAEAIVAWAIEELRIPGRGFAASTDAGARDAGGDANGLMIVALVEAGSVFERRDWLALARKIFGEVVDRLDETGERRGGMADGVTGTIGGGAAMSRAAIRLFEAFGKRRDLDLAEAWVAAQDLTLRGIAENGITDRPPSLDDALRIGVLARLHALTGTSRYAERAKDLVQALHPGITRSAIVVATSYANVQTAERLLSIRVTGDPRLPETRELMRIALDCGLPDRLVLGPGAGGTLGERPLAHIRAGASHLAPIDDPAQLRIVLAPGGLAAFLDLDTRETVDSRRMGGIP